MSLWIDGFIVLILAIFIYAFIKERKRSNLAANFSLRLKLILTHVEDIWVIWNHQGLLMFSPHLSTFLGVAEQNIQSPQDFMSFFVLPPDKDIQTLMAEIYGNPNEYSFHAKTKKDNLDFQAHIKRTYIRDVPSYIMIINPHHHSQQNTNQDAPSEEGITQVTDTILNYLPVPIWIKNKNQQLTYCNNAYAQLLDSTPEKVLNEKKQINTWTKGNFGISLTEQVIRSNTKQTQNQHAIVNGDRCLFSMTEQPDDKYGIVGYALDINKIEILENEMEQITVSHQKLLEQLLTPIAIYDKDTHLIFYNDGYLKLFDHEQNWLDAKPTYNEVMENLRERRQLPEVVDFKLFKKDRLNRFVELEQNVEELFHLPDGRTIRLSTIPFYGGGLVIMFNDVTEQLLLERRYNTLLSVHHQALDNLYEGVAVFAGDNRLSLRNESFMRMWNLSAEQCEYGNHISDIIEGTKPLMSYKNEWSIFKNKAVSIITDRIAKGGTLLLKNEAVYDYSYVPLPDGSHLITFLNVSDRRRIEKALLERNEALEATVHIKSQLINNFSEAVRQPIHSIMDCSQSILENIIPLDLENEKQKLKQINFHTQNLMGLVDDIVEFASKEIDAITLRIIPVDLKKLLNEIKTLAGRQAIEKNVTIQINCDDTLDYVVVDPTRFKQALFILLSLAVKHTNESQNVSVIAKDKLTEIQVVFSDHRPIGNQNSLFKNEEGIIPTDEEFAVSMKVVRHIIDLHHGQMTIYPNPENDGISVEIRIPRILKV